VENFGVQGLKFEERMGDQREIVMIPNGETERRRENESE